MTRVRVDLPAHLHEALTRRGGRLHLQNAHDAAVALARAAYLSHAYGIPVPAELVTRWVTARDRWRAVLLHTSTPGGSS